MESVFSHQSATIVVIMFCCFSMIVAQQPYVGKDTTNCGTTDDSKSDLGYFYNGQNSSCQSYLTFRSQPPYNNVTSISNLLSADPSQVSTINGKSETETLETDMLVFVPINCSSSGQFYQLNTSYVVQNSDTILAIANNTYQGLTTCQAVQNQTKDLTTTKLIVGQTLHIPLRCACPTKNQTDVGIKYLLSYLVTWNEDLSSISERFGANSSRTFEANELSEQNFVIYPFTTLLVPLENPPTASQTISPPPPPSTSPPPPPPSPGSGGGKTWVYIVIGVAAGVVVIILSVIFCVFFYRRKKKSDPIIVSESFEAYNYEKPAGGKKSEEIESEDYFLESVSSIAQSVKVYKYGEIVSATDNFSPSCWIKASVYRGNFDGDFAAIKKMNGDVSKEINLLSMINHTNLIRLSGVCYHDGNWYLVYEYAVNGPLTDWIHDRKTLTWMQRMKIGLDVATGLDYLHSFTTPPHVHKDIKSGNILLDENFGGKIANFALARSVEEGEFALTRHIVGTKGYIAPEYLEHGLVSTKLDVYSFGVLMLEIITGKEAAGSKKMDLSTLLPNEDGQEDGLKQFVDPCMNGNYPPDLVKFMIRLIDRCVKKDPMDRPSMDEIVRSLSRIVDSSRALETKS